MRAALELPISSMWTSGRYAAVTTVLARSTTGTLKLALPRVKPTKQTAVQSTNRLRMSGASASDLAPGLVASSG